MVYRRTFDERFWPQVAKTEVCWLWTGPVTQSGYGQMTHGGRTTGAHRASYLTFVGPIPDGYEIDHLCRVRNCVNPEHLEPVTHEENVRRAWAAVTHCKRGHEFGGDNLLISSGRRRCRECAREQTAVRAAARAEARMPASVEHRARTRAALRGSC